MRWKVVMALMVFSVPAIWGMREAVGYTGPDDEPGWNGKAKMSGSQGFYLGCRWIDSAKDIPVPEEVEEGWEKLLRSARIENEEKRQNILAQWRLQWQKEEFRRWSRRLIRGNQTAEQRAEKNGSGLLSSASGCQCEGCKLLIPVVQIHVNDNCIDSTPPERETCRRCVYCAKAEGVKEIERFVADTCETAEAQMWNFVEQQIMACCPYGQPGTECGYLYAELPPPENFDCCWRWYWLRPCTGKKMEGNLICRAVCSSGLPWGCEECHRCPALPPQACGFGAPASIWARDCCNCCGPDLCGNPPCGSRCSDGQCNCKTASGELTTNEVCSCDPCM